MGESIEIRILPYATFGYSVELNPQAYQNRHTKLIFNNFGNSLYLSMCGKV